MATSTDILERGFMWLFSPAKQGFTLIELLVTTALGLLMLGGVISAYSSLATQQARSESARDVIVLLRTAQNRSRSGDKPPVNCDRLDGYRVYGFANTQNYAIVPRCDDDDVVAERVNHQLRDLEHFLNDFSVTFPTQPGPVIGAPVTVRISRLDELDTPFEFEITTSGVVEEQGIRSTN